MSADQRAMATVQVGLVSGDEMLRVADLLDGSRNRIRDRLTIRKDAGHDLAETPG
ncbi:hypothetical protein C8K30_11921 [Promicromonospora sp. AC04]|nr:hypothetical protein C8K30_11921 [Promicromonospora sp. AC04]